MKQPRKAKGLLEALLIIGLILIIPLFFAFKSRANQLAVKMTPTLVAATDVPTLLPVETPAVSSPAATAKRPSACTFPLAQTATQEAIPQNYTFSEPKVVLTAPANINIIDWLPDNQHVLITRDIPSKNQQSIELFDPQTGKVQVFALRRGTGLQEAPAWIENLNAILYPETFPLSISYDKNGRIQYPINIKRSLWLSRGNAIDTQVIEDTLVAVNVDQPSIAGASFTLAAKSDGSQVIYLDKTGKHLQQRNVVQNAFGTARSLPFESSQWDYRRSNNAAPISFKMTWRPSATQIFLYSGPSSGSYTFLFDTVDGQICELNLFDEQHPESWVMNAHWSQNGRYLAVVRAMGRGQLAFSDLIILDTTSGKLYQIDANKLRLTDIDTQGKYFIGDVAWAPDNYYLAAIGQVNYYLPGSDTLQVVSRLYLVDFVADQANQISSQEIASNIGETSLLWSKDGAQLLVKCPTHEEGRLCLVNVQKSVQN